MAGRTVVGTTDRHRPFNGMESLNSVTDLQYGPSQARRTVVMRHFKTLQLLRIWYRERLSELCDGMAGRTVTDPWWKYWVSEPCDDLQDGPS